MKKRRITYLAIVFFGLVSCSAGEMSKSGDSFSFILESSLESGSTTSSLEIESSRRETVKTVEEFFNKYSAVQKTPLSDDSMFKALEGSEGVHSANIVLNKNGEINGFDKSFDLFIDKKGNTFEVMCADTIVKYDIFDGEKAVNRASGEHLYGLYQSNKIEPWFKNKEVLSSEKEQFIDIIARSKTDNGVTEIGAIAVYPDPNEGFIELSDGQIFKNWKADYVFDYVFPSVGERNQDIWYEDIMSFFDLMHNGVWNQ